ncbi:MAG: hypothetical protein RL757_957 [Bacteroidota bacterium]|jgi:HlyD family secretion protein
MNSYKITFLAVAILLTACQNKTIAPDATGIFEADEVIISAESAGVLKKFDVAEGQKLTAGQLVGQIDCDQLSLQKAQIEASAKAMNLRQAESAPQTKVFGEQIAVQNQQILTQREQLRVLEIEQRRIARLVAAEAAPAKQLDDINGQIAVLEKQIAAAQVQINVLQQQIKSQEQTTAVVNRGVLSEQEPLRVRGAQIADQMRRCNITNPVSGVVLSKYAAAFEMAAAGKPLYKIANLDQLSLRAYVTGNQLPNIKIGQEIVVKVAQSDGKMKDYKGKITWISDKSEFTPKSIQTKDERANLVYAIKIVTPNDGFLKIGMYADVDL